MEHPSLFVRFPLEGTRGRVARRVDDDAVDAARERRGRGEAGRGVRPPRERRLGRGGALSRRTRSSSARAARSSSACEYTGPFDDLPAQEGVVHRVIPWDEVVARRGHRHRPHRAGLRRRGLRALAPVRPARADADRRVGRDAAGVRRARRAVDDRRGRAGGRVPARARAARGCGHDRPPLSDLLALQDAARVPRRRRLVHLRQEIRQPMLDANDTVEWTPPQYKKRMDDWLRNMGDWNISRKRYFGLAAAVLSVRVRAPERDRLARASSRRARRAGSTQLQELHRPWIDDVTIRCEPCGERGRARRRGRRRVARRRHRPLLDARLAEPGLGGRRATAPAPPKGLTRRRLPDHAYWEKWFPADWVSEMREQIRLWFYSQCFMAVTLDGRSPYRRVLDVREGATTRRAGRCTSRRGNAIELNEALERMGADVARWLFCEQQPSQPLRFGYGMADDVKRRLLTFWNSVVVLRHVRERRGVRSCCTRGRRPAAARPLARVAHARSSCATRPTRTSATGRPASSRRSSAFVDDLSNWYIRRSRRRFWDGDPAALRVAVGRADGGDPGDRARDAVRRGSPVAEPRLARTSRCSSSPWPEAGEIDEALLAEVAEVRRVVELGRQARAASGLKLRQPLRRLVVAGRAMRRVRTPTRSPRSCA